MATVLLEFLSEHSDRVQQHLRQFFDLELHDRQGVIDISLRFGSHGWRVVHVTPPEHAREVRRILYRAGGGDERRQRSRPKDPAK